MKENNDQLKKAKLLNEINFQISGGTLYTIFESLLNLNKRSSLGFDPISKLIGN